LNALSARGQAVWLDFLARDFLEQGGLKRLVEANGVRGVTSNPSIFEQAIANSDAYDTAVAALLAEADLPAGEIYERLAIADIRKAADILQPVYEATGGADGYVSLEVSPYLARDRDGTRAEAERLWRDIGRDNLMIKVPATPEALPAIRDLVAAGINVNVTLLFAQRLYAQVAEAFLSGLETRAKKGEPIGSIAGVASFFVSRIDTAVDQLLDERIAKANDPDEKTRLNALKGKIAIANAKIAYQHFLQVFAGARWDALERQGARPQRLLWASTGTKNKAYSDVLYVDELIGPDTVNTMPVATLDAFRDHGQVRESLTEDIAGARHRLAELERAGISLDHVTDRLMVEGLRQFSNAADRLLAAVAQKRADTLKREINPQQITSGQHFEDQVNELAEHWRRHGQVRKLWSRDKSLWTSADEDRWLGWLDPTSDREIESFKTFAAATRRDGFTEALLIGMGGSSLGPEVLAETFGPQSGWPRLRIMDSTVPAQIKAVENTLDLERTLFIVASKSGSTTEPNLLKDYFFGRLAQKVGAARAARQFVAITDPGSSLDRVAKEQGFRQVFYGVPAIGGRYSVLSPFGLVPAAIAGIDPALLVAQAGRMMRSCGAEVPPAANPGVALGLALGAAALRGRDKITFSSSPGLSSFGAWAEQLIAESTGKGGKGLIPIDGEPLARPEAYGDDRFFIDLTLHGEADTAREARLAALQKAGHPVVRIVVNSPAAIAQEFFRFEIATAVAGAVLGINPFDQPDVEASKVKTRSLTAAFETTGALPAETSVCSGDGLTLYADAANAEALRRKAADMGAEGDPANWLSVHFDRAGSGDYIALLSYLAPDAEIVARLQALRLEFRDRRRVATCVEFGPRFLHSTGQAYKGGPDSGVFLQITADDNPDLTIPGHRATFGVVKSAQARGDFDVLAERGRRALRVHLRDPVSGLAALEAALRRSWA
jgi:transaldolase/glucose-6-phosphate isomerase